MKTAISISNDEFKAAERLAKRLGMTRSELYRTAIAGFVGRHNEDKITEKLNEVYGPDSESATLELDLQMMQALSIDNKQW